MTTIVYDRPSGIMAADKRCLTGNDIICAPVVKIRRLEDGTLVGCAGSIVLLEHICRWLADDPEKPYSGPSKGDAMVVSPSGDVHMMQEGILYEIRDDFPVLGSGGQVALGAMAAGAGAVQAVRIASRYDAFSGDGVDVLHLDGSDAT